MLLDMYVEYGFYKENLISLTKKGKSGAEEIQTMMKELRATHPKTLSGSPVEWMFDYDSQLATNIITGATKKIELPQENVLQFKTADGTLVSARPSGTEPKIKFYFSVNEPLASRAEFAAVDKKLDAKIQTLISDLKLA